MSHTLHRRGTEQSLGKDFVVFAMTAKGFNEKNSAPALKEFLRILSKYDLANMGDMKTGGEHLVPRERIIESVQDTSIVHGVFTDREQVRQALREIRDADLGVSVNVSGIVEDVHEILEESGVKRHTVEYSVGISGNLSRLPEAELLEITTMCGHGMVSQSLVRSMLLDIKKGVLSPREAGVRLATPCVCGVFNPRRAEQLLAELVELWCFDEE